MYICQLESREKLEVFKKIKKALLECNALTPENLRIALNSKVEDIEE